LGGEKIVVPGMGGLSCGWEEGRPACFGGARCHTGKGKGTVQLQKKKKGTRGWSDESLVETKKSDSGGAKEKNAAVLVKKKKKKGKASPKKTKTT